MSEIRLLALDTSTEACSAALLVGDAVLERYEVAPRAHASLILGMIDALLGEGGVSLSQLDAIAFGCGPGAFTGVRIATGVVQGIAFGAELPVVPVSSLAALAQDAMDHKGHSAILAAIDARMGELYWGVYQADQSGVARLSGEEQVASADTVTIPTDSVWFGVGSGWGECADILAQRLAERLAGVIVERYPRARSTARLGALHFREGLTVSAEKALPVYLRNKVVHTR